ncbi:hypothetical protein Ancab_030516 [Ancistrocladus abbreviatus]
MECNKEEAIRAKGIAEQKMESKDFLAARKFALKAQQLHPDLENVSQMLCVCDVHCSAENKMLGNEMDWYGILQVEQTADEALIKKQYRKFALLLHPDKNKFAGAEAAFKLIGEAQRVLLDKDKRSFFDMKRRASFKPAVPSRASQQANRNANVVRQSKSQSKVAGNANSHGSSFNSTSNQQQSQAQSGVPNGKETFWTLCPFCAVRYQYYKEVLNRALRCQSCKKPFIAYDMCAQGVPPGANKPHHPSFPKNVPDQGTANPACSDGFQSSSGPRKATVDSFPKSAFSEEAGGSQRTSNLHKGACKVDKERHSGGLKPTRKVNGRKGKKQVEESSESCESGSSIDSEEGTGMDQDVNILSQGFGMDGESNPRRSARSRRHVSYNENLSDDEEVLNPAKRPKESVDALPNEKPSNPLKRTEGSGNSIGNEYEKGTSEDNLKSRSGGATSNSSLKTEPEPEVYEYPDPDFSNFDDERKEECFVVGQIWAVYDTLDAMPRFYARIRKVLSPGFKLRITWLEPDPDNDADVEWAIRELPYSCGRFKQGQSENTEDRPMFSHLMSWEKGSGRDCFKIYPKKGETWALFQNWDIKWSSSPDSDRKFEYDFVEVLSEYDYTVGIHVAYLGKLKGFGSLFCQKGEDELIIPPNEVLRFSHRVPSCKMTGKEREDVPRGSFELDPASISKNLEEITLPKKVTVGPDSVYSNGLSSRSSEANHFVKEVDGRTSTRPNVQVGIQAEPGNNFDDVANDPAANGAPLIDVPELPEPEFYDFDAMKSLDKFQVGQIWALYSDLDGLPKYYGLIKKVDPNSDFKLYVAWLEACFLPSNMIVWQHKEMPICCGRFKIKSSRVQPYNDAAPFSHQLRGEPTAKKNVFAIYPQKGEVWALYKNWNAEMTTSDLENCDYDIVEVLEEEGFQLRVLILERVRGFNCVFKVQMNENSPVTMEIPHVELLRFSHQIPSYRLTGERNGTLKGFWELDPAAVPVLLFCTN